MYKLYCITVIPTGKKYVGVTAKSVNQRLQKHRSDARRNQRLGNTLVKWQRALLKYSFDQLKVEILHTFENKEEAYINERLTINELNTISNGYNTHEGGIGGRTRSPQQLADLSKLYSSDASPFKRPGVKERRDASVKRYRESEQFTQWVEENRTRLSDCHKGEKNGNFGKPRSREHSQHLSESHKKRHSKIKTAYTIYTLVSPQGDVYEFNSLQKLADWCILNEYSLWTVQCRLLRGKAPKSGALFGWTASSKRTKMRIIEGSDD